MKRQNDQTDKSQPQGEWTYKPDNETTAADVATVPPEDFQTPDAVPGPIPMHEVAWTASEYVAHNKGISWFLLLALSAVGLAAVLWFITGDKLTVAVVVIVAIILAAAASRKPRVLEYHLDERGLTIQEKFYPYAEFRSFSVMPEGAFTSIMFVPLKRFALPISIYYDPQDETEIATVISQHLPLEDRGHDMIDQFAHRIRF